MLILKQSTSADVLIGPFVDKTDGNTVEGGLTIANTDIRLSKNGANIVAKNSLGGTHDELGYYTITLDSTDTNTVGKLQLMAHHTDALPVYHEYMVVEEAIYDALFAASATGALPVSSGGIAASAFASGALDAAALNADAVAEIVAGILDLSNGIETSITPRQALRLMLSALAGKLSGAATTTVTIRNVGDSKDRITATVDADGNRTAVTTDAT